MARTEDEVLQQEQRLADAKRALDLETVDNIYADDLLMSGVMGEPTCSKGAILDEVRRGIAQRDQVAAGDPHVVEAVALVGKRWARLDAQVGGARADELGDARCEQPVQVGWVIHGPTWPETDRRSSRSCRRVMAALRPHRLRPRSALAAAIQTRRPRPAGLGRRVWQRTAEHRRRGRSRPFTTGHA